MEKNSWLWIVAIVAVLVFVSNPNILGNLFGGQQAAPATTPQGSGTNYIVTTATTLSFSAVDALSPGTAVTNTVWAAVNGAPFKSGVTSVNPGDKLEILLVNATTYHNVYIQSHVVPSTTVDIQPANFYGNASASLTLFNNNNVAMTNGGGATNQTVASGGAYNMKVRIDGQDKKSTQAMRCILEASDGTKADTMTLSGLGAKYVGMAKPSSYTLAATTSQVWVYDVDAVVGAVAPEGTVSITSKTAQSLAGTYFKITCKTKEHFLDANTGKVAFDIENSLGTSQSLASYTFTGYFT